MERLNAYIEFLTDTLLPQVFIWLELMAVFWIPLILISIAWQLWVRYVRKAWLIKQKKILLEIKLPQETFKSPAAMELVLTALYQTSGEGTPLDRYWDGKVRPWFSLEIVSIGGDIRFFIWTFESQKNIISANIYAQYPDVSIQEVDDYTKDIYYDPLKYELWGCELSFLKPDAYPIKTYVDYGLDKDPKEEFKIDPMSPMLEFLGTPGPTDNIWIQMMVRAHKEEKNVFNRKLPDKWVLDAKKEIEKIIKEAQTENKVFGVTTDIAKLTKAKQETINSLERSVTKYGFDVGIRCVYIAPKESFNKGNAGGVAGSFKQYAAGNLNGFKPNATGFDYKWQDWFGKKEAKWKLKMFEWYLARSYFHPPYAGSSGVPRQKMMVLNVEELATIFHFPGSAVRTPGLKRIPSKRAEAPTNLPV